MKNDTVTSDVSVIGLGAMGSALAAALLNRNHENYQGPVLCSHYAGQYQ